MIASQIIDLYHGEVDRFGGGKALDENGTKAKRTAILR